MREVELKILNERRWFLGMGMASQWMKIRHYNDATWEILDENDIPIIQGKCGQTIEQDFQDLTKKVVPHEPEAKP